MSQAMFKMSACATHARMWPVFCATGQLPQLLYCCKRTQYFNKWLFKFTWNVNFCLGSGTTFT